MIAYVSLTSPSCRAIPDFFSETVVLVVNEPGGTVSVSPPPESVPPAAPMTPLASAASGGLVTMRRRAEGPLTVIVPDFVQVAPATEAVSDHVYVPGAAYACEAFCWLAVWPSPKLHA